jgi:hypothetical protein
MSFIQPKRNKLTLNCLFAKKISSCDKFTTHKCHHWIQLSYIHLIILVIIVISKLMLKNIFIILFCLPLIYSCSLPGADARKVSPNAKERALKNSQEGQGFRLMNSIGSKGTNFEFASSNELWRASLDTVDFMPLTTANYSGGIIVTDWYSDNKNSKESIKINIRFLTNEIRSDAIDIKIFNKICDETNQCYVNEGNDNLIFELKKQILEKATRYKAQAETK